MPRDTVMTSWGRHPPPSPFILCNNARPHVARICTQFLEAENVPVLPWPAYSPDMPHIEHVWDALGRCVRQRTHRLQFQPISSNFTQRDNIPQATINSLINSMRRRCVELHEQIVVTPDTDWFTSQLFFVRYLGPTDAYLYSQSYEINRLFFLFLRNTHLESAGASQFTFSIMMYCRFYMYTLTTRLAWFTPISVKSSIVECPP